MLASAAGLEPAVSALLLAGADPLSRDLDGNTALHMAYAYSSAATIVQVRLAVPLTERVGLSVGPSACLLLSSSFSLYSLPVKNIH